MDSKERIKERMNAHEYEKTIQKLLEKIDILENKLKSAGIDRIKIVTGFKQLEQENNFLKTENEKMEKEKEDATKNSNDASTQLEILPNLLLFQSSNSFILLIKFLCFSLLFSSIIKV